MFREQLLVRREEQLTEENPPEEEPGKEDRRTNSNRYTVPGAAHHCQSLNLLLVLFFFPFSNCLIYWLNILSSFFFFLQYPLTDINLINKPHFVCRTELFPTYLRFRFIPKLTAQKNCLRCNERMQSKRIRYSIIM